MIGPLGRTAYQVSQGVRFGWFGLQSAVTARLSERPKAPPELRQAMPAARRLAEDRRALLRRELANIEAGYYRLPHDLIESPAAVLRRTVRYYADLQAVNRRLRRGERPNPPPGAERYPDYYRAGFHNQTDGYLSQESAELYDYQVEVVFGGAADAMRRQALVPLHRHLRGTRIADRRLLDIACGTGRFLTFVKDNYPRLPVTALEISPFYLAEAKRRLKAWSRVTFVEGRAEAMPLPEACFDAATCIFLLHELPAALHSRVAAEIARVLKPGGLAIVVDSLQLGDRVEYDALLRYFPMAFHEPYYADYIRQDLGRTFSAAGLRLEQVDLAYLSRVMLFRKDEAVALKAPQSKRQMVSRG